MERVIGGGGMCGGWAVLFFPNATAGHEKLSQRLLQTLMPNQTG